VYFWRVSIFKAELCWDGRSQSYLVDFQSGALLGWAQPILPGSQFISKNHKLFLGIFFYS